MEIDSHLKPSLFMREYTPLFLSRFNIFYTQDEEQMQYCISEIDSKNDISCSIELEMDRDNKHVNVLMFYPGLEKLKDTHYFSSVCFFLIIHHFVQFYKLSPQYSVYLKTKESIFNDFYSKFFDFHFTVDNRVNSEMLYAISLFEPMEVDVSMIINRDIDLEHC